MKLQHLRCLLAVVDAGFNITLAAEHLFATQPGVSKTLALLEEELGFPLFERRGRVLTGLTNPAREVVNRARKVLREIENIKTVAADWRLEDQGQLRIATSQFVARHFLPAVLKRFRERYPRIAIDIRLGRNTQLAYWMERGEADLVLVSGNIAGFEALTRFDCLSWQYQLLMPSNHPLALSPTPIDTTLLANIPLWVFNHEGKTELAPELAHTLSHARLAGTTWDCELLKNHVRKGAGLGLIPALACPATDSTLAMRPLAANSTTIKTWLGLKSDAVLRRHTMSLIQQLAPQLTERDILGQMGAEDYKTIMYYI